MPDFSLGIRQTEGAATPAKKITNATPAWLFDRLIDRLAEALREVQAR